MHAPTGVVLALASLPDYDPNDRPVPVRDPKLAGTDPTFNRAVQGVYELGSTFKIFTVAQALDLNLVELAQGEQPFPDYPGYWRVELPAGEEYFLRVEGPDHYPALYRGQAPTGHGLTSALFGFEVGPTADFFAGVEEAVGLDIGLESPDLVHLWGVPNLGDEDSTVHCEDLAVLHNGAAASVVCFALNEDGVLAQTSAGPVDHFFAFNMLPGELIVRVTVGDEQLEELWFPQGGDIVAAWYFEGLR